MYLVAGRERDGLHGLADAHLIGDQRSAAAAQRETHALPLEGQEGTRQHGRHASKTVLHLSVARLLISTPARVAFQGDCTHDSHVSISICEETESVDYSIAFLPCNVNRTVGVLLNGLHCFPIWVTDSEEEP